MTQKRKAGRLVGLLSAALLASALSVAGQLPALAATNCTVNSIGDEHNAGGGNCNSTAGGVTLRSAIERVSVVGGTALIDFNLPNPSTITLTVANGELHLLGSPVSNVTIQGPGSSALTIDGNGAATGRRILEINSGATVTIEGLTMTGGAEATSPVGGAILKSGTEQLTVTGSRFTNNSVTNGGTGIGGAIESSSGPVVVSRTVFSGNMAKGSTGLGGAIQSTGGAITVDQSDFNGNLAGTTSGSTGLGGAIQDTSGPITLTSSTVTGNVAGTGAGSTGVGGGLQDTVGDVTLTNVTLSGNSAAVATGSNAVGGGLEGTTQTVTVVDSTIADNVAGQSDSAAAVGGGVSIGGGTHSARNTIFSRNTAKGVFLNCSGANGSLGHNLEFPSLTDCGLVDPTDLVGFDPMLSPLADNGGGVHTRALLPTSPAIDKIPVASCAAATDERQVPRPQGSLCDIGAFEYLLAVTMISPNTGPAAGGTSVTVTGIGFNGATAVRFGTVSAASFTVNSDQSITAVSPPGGGTVDVTVTTPARASATSSADQFTFQAPGLPTAGARPADPDRSVSALLMLLAVAGLLSVAVAWRSG